MSQIWYRPSPLFGRNVQGSRVKNQTCPMRLQGLRSVDQYFTGLSGLPPSALCRVGPGIEWILLLFFLPSLRYLRSSLRYGNLLYALLPLRFCTGSTRGQDVSFDLRVPSTQSDEVGKPQSPAPNLIGPCTRIPAAYWRWKIPPRRTGHLSHPWHSRPSHGWSGAFH